MKKLIFYAMAITILAIACEKSNLQDSNNQDGDIVVDTFDAGDVIDVFGFGLENAYINDNNRAQAKPTAFTTAVADFEYVESQNLTATFNLKISSIPAIPLDGCYARGTLTIQSNNDDFLFKVFDQDDPNYIGIVTGITCLLDWSESPNFGFLTANLWNSGINPNLTYEELIALKIDALNELFSDDFTALEMYQLKNFDFDTIKTSSVFNPADSLGSLLYIKGEFQCSFNSNLNDIIPEFVNYIIDSPRQLYWKEEE